MNQLLLVFIFIAISNTAFAVELKKEIAKCANVEGELARLVCYDKLADTVGVSKKKTTNLKRVGNWLVEIDKNPIDDSKTVVGILSAQDGTSKWGKPVSLFLRCRSKETDVYINWGSYLGNDNLVVLTRIGAEEATANIWTSSTDKTATFYQGEVIEFIKKLSSSKKFVAQLTPYMESPITAIFDLTGIDKVTRYVKETCEWDKPETTSDIQDPNK